MNIVIIDQNIIYRESLRTALDQIPDFKVVFDMDNPGSLENINNIQVHMILIDYSFGKIKCNETMMKAVSLWPDVKFLLLSTYKEECILNSIQTIDVMLKNSTKKEFENKIRQQQSAS
jgi:DNA-binding NarL/FixJ family response regulator